MASKSETRAAIINLSKELGKELPAGLDQIDKLDQLQPLLDALEAEKLGRANSSVGDDGVTSSIVAGAGVGGPPPAPTETEQQEELPIIATTYAVNEGKQVTTKRGAIGALEQLWPSDFAGGQKDLDHWVSNGFVTKTDHRGVETNTTPPAK